MSDRYKDLECLENFPFRMITTRHVADILQLYRDELIALKARVKELEEK